MHAGLLPSPHGESHPVRVGEDPTTHIGQVTLYVFEPVACTPASGWEKGQVENQVGNVREWLFTPLARFADFEALNEWLAMRCRELAQRKHPATPDRSIAACFVEEQLALRQITATFDGYVEHMLRVSSTCLVVLDRNRYSVPAVFAGRAVSVRSTATQVSVVALAFLTYMIFGLLIFVVSTLVTYWLWDRLTPRN